MTRSALRGRLRPTDQQRDLLRCALGDDETVRRTWASVRAGMDFDDLDEGSHGILPLVYLALMRAGVDDPLLPRLKGIYRKAWFATRLLLAGLRRPLGALEQAAAEPLLLHGTAMAAAHYEQGRRIAVLDVAVRPGSERRALRALETSGWARHPEAPADGAFPVPLVDLDGRVLFVHAGLPEALQVPGAPVTRQDEMWSRARTVSVGDASALVLDPTDELLCALASGPDVGLIPQAQWLADAATIVRGGDVEWGTLADRAAKRLVAARVRAGLGYLADELGVDLPPSARVTPADVPRRDALAYALYRRRGGPLRGLPRTLSAHVRLTADRGGMRVVLGAPRFLSEAWGLESRRELPRALARKALRG